MARSKKNLSPTDKLRSLSRRSAPGGVGTDAEKHFMSKLDEALFYINMVKNSATVKTGEYEALTRLFTGQKIYVDTRDVSESPHLMLDGIREENVTKAFRAIWKPDYVYFDVGVNYGYYALMAGTNIKKEGVQLHLFEANPDLIPLLEKTVSVNGLTATSKLVNVAITDKPGKVKLHRIKNLWGGATTLSLEKLRTYRPVQDEFDRHFTVEGVTIDQYCKEENVKRVDLVKIDVEGAEDKVYAGMKETIKKNRDLKILLEFTFGAYKNNGKDLFKQFKKDFEFVFAVDDNGNLVQVADFDDLSRIAQSEWVMVLLSQATV